MMKKKKIKDKPKFCLIKHTIFPNDILIAVSTYEEVVKYIERNRKYKLSDLEKERLGMKGDGHCTLLGGGQIIIRLPKQKTDIGIDVCDLAHETVHAALFVCDRAGIKITDDSDELLAYYCQYIMRQALNYFDK